MIQLIPEFEEGTEVQFKTDTEGITYLVTGYLIHGKELMYEVSIGGVQRTYAYAIELVEVEVVE